MNQTDVRPKRPYEPPRLVRYGGLHELTRTKGGTGNDCPVVGTDQNCPSKQCWIAEVLYGVNDPRTQVLRAWLSSSYAFTPIGKWVVGVYRRFGRQVAAAAKNSPALRILLRPLFDRGLRRAQAYYMNAT